MPKRKTLLMAAVGVLTTACLGYLALDAWMLTTTRDYRAELRVPDFRAGEGASFAQTLGLVMSRPGKREYQRYLSTLASPARIREITRTPLVNRDRTLRLLIVRHPNAPADVLAEMAQQEMQPLPAAFPSLLARFMPPEEDPVKGMMPEAANAANLLAASLEAPPEALAALAPHPSWVVRYSLANNKRTPPEVLTLLARDADARVVERAANNYKTPIEVIEELALHPEFNVRRALVHRARESRKLATQLSTDNRWEIRQAVSYQPNMPCVALRALANDPEPHVQQTATPLYWKKCSKYEPEKDRKLYFQQLPPTLDEKLSPEAKESLKNLNPLEKIR